LAQLPWDTIGVWVAALLTLAIYSYLAGANRLYSLVQHVFVGVSMGYAVVIAWRSLFVPRLVQFIGAPGSYWYYPIFFVLGIAILSRAFPRVSWLGGFPLAYLFGIGAALCAVGAIAGSLVPQTEASMVSLLPAHYGGGEVGLAYALDAALVSFGAVATLLYFYLGARQKGGIGGIWSRLVMSWGSAGRWLIVALFGALFAGLATGRIAVLISRLRFLLGDWLGLMGS
jgi:hypothetical protein